MPVTAYSPRDYDGLDVGVGHIPGFFDTLNALIAQSNANEVAAGAHEARHGEGGADPLSSLPAAAILGASAHTIANVITYLDTNPAPMRYQGAIALPADFPDPLVVQAGDLYTCTADVTDNDPTKTNTGLSFLTGDEIAWNGATWDNLGTLRAHAATHASGGSDPITDLASAVTLDGGADTLALITGHEARHGSAGADALTDIAGACTIDAGGDSIGAHAGRHDAGGADPITDLAAAVTIAAGDAIGGMAAAGRFGFFPGGPGADPIPDLTMANLPTPASWAGVPADLILAIDRIANAVAGLLAAPIP